MTRDRLDWLLQRALEEGALPAEATAGERAELERMLAVAGEVNRAALATALEAEPAAARARARFAAQVVASGSARPRGSPRAPARPGRLAWAGVMAAFVAVVAAGALALVFVGDGAESAVALEPGDFLQLQGTVESAVDTPTGRTLRLRTPLGSLEVEVPSGTPFSNGTPGRPLSELTPGVGLLVTGVVGNDRRLTAQSLASGEVATHGPGRVERLPSRGGHFTGELLSFALARDGVQARVVVLGPGGRRFLVSLDGPAAARLLEHGPSALGRRVSVSRDERGNPVLAFEDAPPLRPGAALFEVKGVVSAVLPGALEVTTREGKVNVLLQDSTRVVAVDHKGAVSPGVGDAVAVSGTRDESGQVAAQIVVVGRGQGGPAR